MGAESWLELVPVSTIRTSVLPGRRVLPPTCSWTAYASRAGIREPIAARALGQLAQPLPQDVAVEVA